MTKSVSYQLAIQNRENTFSMIREDHPHIDLGYIKEKLNDLSKWKNERVPLLFIQQDTEILSALLDEPLIGIKVVDRLNLDTIPTIKILSSYFKQVKGEDCLVKLILFLSHFFATMTQVIAMELKWKKNNVDIILLPHQPKTTIHQVEGAALGIVKVLKHLTGIKPSSIKFPHPNAAPKDLYSRYFFSQVEFNQNEYVISYPVNHFLESIDTNSLGAVSGLNCQLTNEFPALNTSEQCKILIKSILHFGDPSRELIASFMGISVSTLTRKLKDEEVNFKELLLDIRKTLAKELLIEFKMPASQVAYLLGYHTLSHFYRAFKNWYGITVGEFIKVGAKN